VQVRVLGVVAVFDLNEAALIGDELPDLPPEFDWEFLEAGEILVTMMTVSAR
jgi:hypothetical protein